MDVKETWARHMEWPFEGASIMECNVVVHSDGGTRANNCSAAAWVVEVGLFRAGKWKYHTLAMSGTYLDHAVSSFLVESIALEEASLFLRRFLERRCSDEPLGKRSRQI